MSNHVPDNPYPDEKDTTVYHIGHGVSRLIALPFFVIIALFPVVHHISQAIAGKWSETPLAKLLSWDTHGPESLIGHLHSVEKSLDTAAYAVTPRQLLQGGFTRAFGEGNRKVFVGFDGWLFYQPDVKALTGYGPLKPEPFSVMKDPELAKLPVARNCIAQFAAQLKERGIQLLFVPVPLKPMFYSDDAAAKITQPWITHPDATAFYESLRQQGVDVLDVSADFARLRDEPKHIHYLEATTQNREIAKQSEEALMLKKEAFLKQDTHWTPDAMRLTAEKVAEHVKAKYPHAMRPMARTIAAVDGVNRESIGDLVKLLDLKEPKTLFDSEKAFLRVIGEGTEDKFAPIALLGDSFINVFDDPTLGFENPDKPEQRLRAGFAQHLSLVLNQPLDVIAMNGKGSTGVRRELARRYDDEVRAKKLVIWVIAARDVLLSRTAARDANIEWGFVTFNPNRSPDASDVAPPTNVSTQVVIEATLTEKSKNQELNGTPYRDALHAAVYDVSKVIEGKLEAKQILGIQWTFKDKVMQPTASFSVGKRYKLTLVPWETKKELQGLNQQDDTTAFDAERWFVEQAVEVP